MFFSKHRYFRSLRNLRSLVSLTLAILLGCGDGSSTRVCIGDIAFCAATAQSPVAKAGPDQIVVSGDPVTLNGSNSEGSIQSYSWAQTSGPTIALTDANKARATFTAPPTSSDTALTFRLTVVNSADRADTASTVVTVMPAAQAAIAVAFALLDGPLQPTLAGGNVVPNGPRGCGSATSALPLEAAAAQRGLWLTARSIAILKGIDTDDPSGFLDVSRVLVSEHEMPSADVAGRIESFGFMLLGALTQTRDPALSEAVEARRRAAPVLDDPAALLGGRSAVTDVDGIAIEAVADAAGATVRAIGRLLDSRTECVGTTQAVELTGSALRVIADAAPQA